MSKIHHPMRDQEFVFYQRIGVPQQDESRKHIAFFSDYQKYPMYFHASSYEEVIIAAVSFRDSESSRHEKTYLLRIEALRKAREAKKK